MRLSRFGSGMQSRLLVGGISAALGAVGCGAPEEGAGASEELRAFLEAGELTEEERAPARLRALSRAFVEAAEEPRALGAGGARPHETTRAWSPVARGDGSPVEVGAWAEEGHIAPDGAFAPRGGPCAGELGPFPAPIEAELAALTAEEIEGRACAIEAAVRSLAGPDAALAWSGPGPLGVAIGEASAEVNARIILLAVPEAEPAEAQAQAPVAPSWGAVEPADGAGARSRPGDSGAAPAAPLAPRTHRDPGPDGPVSRSGGSSCDGGGSGLDCGGGFDGCNSSSSSCNSGFDGCDLGLDNCGSSLDSCNSCSVRRIRVPTSVPFYALAAALLVARRRARRTRERGQARVRRRRGPPTVLGALLVLGGAGEARAQDAGEPGAAVERSEATLSVNVSPAEATVLVDGKVVGSGKLSHTLGVRAGTVRIRAELAGYEPAETTVTLAPGAYRVVPLFLSRRAGPPPRAGDMARPTAPPNPTPASPVGWARIVAPTSQHAIVVDGSYVGAGAWSGGLVPGEHVVQVYVPGGPIQAHRLAVRPREETTLDLSPTPLDTEVHPGFARATDGPTFKVSPYLGLGVGANWVAQQPARFDASGDGRPGYLLSLNLGARVAPGVGLELYLDAAGNAVSGVVSQSKTSPDGTRLADRSAADYDVLLVRLAPMIRFSRAEGAHRPTAALGLGILHERLDLRHADLRASGEKLERLGTFEHRYRTFQPVFLLEAGYVHHRRNLGLGLSVLTSFAGAEDLAYDESLHASVGLLLRASYAPEPKVTAAAPGPALGAR